MGDYPYEDDTKGHVWLKQDDGEVDIFAYSEGYHNGPRCVKCGYEFCHHCSEGVVPEACPE